MDYYFTELMITLQTKGLSLEEINTKFGEEVVIRMDEVTDKTAADEEDGNVVHNQNDGSKGSSKHEENDLAS